MKSQTDRGVFLPAGMVTSKAYNSLRPYSSTILAHFLRKRKFEKVKVAGKWQHVLANNGQIVFTYAEAIEWGCSKAKFTHIIDDLIEHGFIDIAVPGTGICGSVTLYGISDRWRNFGTDIFLVAKREKRCSHSFLSGSANPRYNPFSSVKNDASQASKMTLSPNSQASKMTLSIRSYCSI